MVLRKWRIKSIMNNKLSSFYKSLKWSEPCLHCGKVPTTLNPNDVDHVKPPSKKLGGTAPRTHKLPGAWWCVPLCTNCHMIRHTKREDRFYSFLRDRKALEEKVVSLWMKYLNEIPEEWQDWYAEQTKS